MCLMKLRNIKKELVEKEVLTLHYKNSSKSTFETSENIFPFVFCFFHFELCTYMEYLFDSVRNQASNRTYLLQLIKRRSKVHQNITSHELVLNFDQ